MQNHAMRVAVEQRCVHAVHAILTLADDRDPGWIDVRQRSEQIERSQNLVDLHRFEGRARHHRLPLHVMKEIIVAEAAKILFQRSTSSIQRFDDQDGTVTPLIPFQWLLIAPDRDALPMIDEQDGR